MTVALFYRVDGIIGAESPSETYLKKPERIESLAFIMVLCLMVYSLLEYRLREGLKKQEKTIPNSLKKPTDRPTLQWAFSFFTSIAEASIFVQGLSKGGGDKKSRYCANP